MDPLASAAPVRFPTVRGADVELFATGFRHPRGRWFPAANRFTPYRELTHLWQAERGLGIATTRGTWSLPARTLVDPAQLGALVGALRQAVGAISGGPERLARMDALDERLRVTPRPVIGRILACVALAVAALIFVSPNLAAELTFRADLVQTGEAWRLLTLHVVHLHPAHLLMNVVALWILGDLVELSLGRGRGWAIAAVSAAGAAGGCAWMGYAEALGASGIVTGFAGALLVLELRAPATLPAPWRLPRGLFVAALVLDGVVLSFVPSVAHGAHAGGFVAGGAFAWLVAVPLGGEWRVPLWLRTVNGVAAVAALAALAMGLFAAADFEGSWERRARVLLERPEASAEALNEAAWTIAIAEAPSEALLALAETLAERAVDRSGRGVPHILDTLAEVYFVQGRGAEALDLNAEALRISPDDAYLREQRRRYRGERAPDDRPDPRGGPDERPIPDAPGIRV